MCVLGVEDELSEAVARKLVSEFVRGDIEISVHGKRGFGYLQANINKFVAMARYRPTLVLTDLDARVCAPGLIEDWCGSVDLPPRFCFRVAEREVEAWLLADRVEFARHLGVSVKSIPRTPDTLADPKQTIIHLAQRGSREARRSIVPDRGSASLQGFDYNMFLSRFVRETWDLGRAAQNSPSLARARRALAIKFSGMR